MSDYRQGFGLDIGFIDHFITQHVIALNYSAIANFDNLQFTREHAKSFPARSVFCSSCFVTVSNNTYSSAFGLKSSVNSDSILTEIFDRQSASLSWNKASIWGLRTDFYYCQTIAGLLMWGTLSDDRMGLWFTIAAGPRQRVPVGLATIFSVSDLRLPFRRLLRLAGLRWRYSTLPPHGRTILASTVLVIAPLHGATRKHCFQQYLYCCMSIRCLETALVYLLISRSLHTNGSTHYNTLDIPLLFIKFIKIVRNENLHV
jgi:hypothetical protein